MYHTILEGLPWTQFQLGVASLVHQHFMYWDPERQIFLGSELKSMKTIFPVLLHLGAISTNVWRAWRIVKFGGVMENILSVTMTVTLFGPTIYGITGRFKSPDIAHCYNALIAKELRMQGRSSLTKYEGSDGKNMWKVGKEVFKNPIQTVKHFLKIYKSEMKLGTTLFMIYSAGISTQMMVPIIVGLLVFIAPCSVSSCIRAGLDDCPVPKGLPEPIIATWYWKILFTFLDIYTSMFCMNNSTTHIVISFNQGCDALNSFIRRLEPNPISDSDLYKNVLAYKEILILQTMLNNNLKSTILPGIFVNINSVGILCLFGVIGLYAQLDVSTIILFFVLSVDCAVMVQVVCYKSAADTNDLSRNILSYWDKNRKTSGNKLNRKIIRGCSDIRIRLGSSGNYLEKLTPLVLLDFTIDKVVSLLLAT